MGKEYKVIRIPYGWSIEEAVEDLLKRKDNGELVCADFNGHTLCSDTVTLDNAYLEVVGKTKEQFDKDRKEWRERLDREKEEHEARIPKLTEEYITKGHEILDEQYWTSWDECVPIRLRDLYRGMELKACLDIVEPLNNGCSLEEAKEIIDSQNHSDLSFGLVRTMVRAFCDRGEEFAKYVK